MRLKDLLMLVPSGQQIIIKDYVTNRTLSTGTLCDVDLDLYMVLERVFAEDDVLYVEVSELWK